MWKDAGLVLEPQYNTSAWDAAGTFTPGIVKECTAAGAQCKFYLFFGGVANESSSHTESVGVAIASSAWGPFKKYDTIPCSACGGGTRTGARNVRAGAG